MKCQLAFPILAALLFLSSLAQETTTSAPTLIASESSPPPPQTTGEILRPSPGETVTVGDLYTISWSPPPLPTGPLALEIKGTNAWIRPILDTTSCDGYAVNTHCDKFDVEIPAGSTSFVWNMTDPGTDSLGVRVDHGKAYRLGLYVDDLERGQIPNTAAEWYWSVSFTIAEPPETTTMTSTTATTTTTASLTAGGTVEPSTSAEATETATDGAVSLRGFGDWNAIQVAVWSLLGLLVY
ncbi:hypothetical protein BJX63DRAFT_99386 [Aspergillus granulosus]|uniref:Uncharacterized protein n=1 Tax=Aspergillus granulosus TaxID=176169 RepID=A0ABR4GUS4_9EURO